MSILQNENGQVVRKNNKVNPLKQKIKFLSLNEVERLFGAVALGGSLRDQAIFQLAYFCGMRISELGLLTHNSWNDKNGSLYVERLKKSLPSHCVLDRKRAEVLRRYLRTRKFITPYDPLFLSRQGGGVSRSLLDKLMRRYAEIGRIKRPLRHFHVLKHSIAVHLLDSMADIKDVQHHLGHADIKNTLIYAQYSSARARKFHDLISRSQYIGK